MRRLVSSNCVCGVLLTVSSNLWKIISRELFRRRAVTRVVTSSFPKETTSTFTTEDDGSTNFSLDAKEVMEAADAFHLSYGHTMAAWGILESHLFSWFHYVSGIENENMARTIYYSAKSFLARMDMLSAALRASQLKTDQIAFLKGAIKTARIYSEFRNSATHGEPLPSIEDLKRPLIRFVLAQGKHMALTEPQQYISIENLDNATKNFTALWGLVRQGHPSYQEDKSPSLESCLEQILALPNPPHSKSDQSS